MLRSLCSLLLLGFAALAQGRSSTGNSVLVVLQPSLKREDFSIFFGDLESEAHFTFARVGLVC